jgi:uncharacterized membrane-anchored protein YitT (DUF2179 family)
MTDATKKWINQGKDYVMIVFGLACYAFGLDAFVLPEKVVTGGVTGIASLLFFGFNFNIAISNYTINLILLVIAYKTVGKQFTIRTIFGATVLSFFIGIFQPFFTQPFVAHQSFMNIIIGAIFCGMGIGTAFVHNGSSAGTDIIAAMMTKHSNVSFGRMMLYMDVVIISSSYFIFHGLDKIVYGFVFLFINSYMADLTINTNRQALQFLIISKKWEDIANAINNDAHRGCTLIHGTGWYTKQDVKILMVMCRRFEGVNIFRIVKAIDNDAFITQSHVNGVYGNGFDVMKVRLHKYKPKISDENTTIIWPSDEDAGDDRGPIVIKKDKTI